MSVVDGAENFKRVPARGHAAMRQGATPKIIHDGEELPLMTSNPSSAAKRFWPKLCEGDSVARGARGAMRQTMF